MKKLVLSAALLWTAASFLHAENTALKTETSASVPRVGYVRFEKINTACHEFVEKEREFKAQGEQLSQDAQKLNADATEFQTKNPDKAKWSTEAAQKAKAEELSARQSRFSTQMATYQKEVQSFQVGMQQKIEKAAQSIAQKRGFDLILGLGGLYVGKNVDLTNDILEKLNNDYDAEKAKAEKAKATPKTPAASKKK